MRTFRDLQKGLRKIKEIYVEIAKTKVLIAISVVETIRTFIRATMVY